MSQEITKPGPITPVYVNPDPDNIANVGRFALTSTGASVFDIAILFAAHINVSDTGSGTSLYFDSNLQEVLDNAATLIAPLRAKGIKVILSVLGHHQGVGWANFPDQQAAADFAGQLAKAVTRYGLDGVDVDDEYADYGKNGTGDPNAWSFPYAIQALRNDLPEKIISLYDIGPASTTLSYEGINVGDLINYSWNPYYGTWNVPDVPGLAEAQLAPAAIDLQDGYRTPASVAGALAGQTTAEGYGAYLTYNLPSGDISDYVSSFTQPLYGSTASYTS